LVSAGTATTSNPKFATALASIFFTSSAPCRPAGGRWNWGDSGTKDPESPCPGSDALSASSATSQQPARGNRGAQERVKAHQPRSHRTFQGGATRRCVGAGDGRSAADRRTDPHGTGLSGRGRQQSPRTGLRYFISSFRKTCQKQLCLTAMCSFFLPFFFIIKERVKLARSLPLNPPLS
jgi:hypothetical protein